MMNDKDQWMLGTRFRVLESKVMPNTNAIQLTDGPYENIIFSFGKVSFNEENDELRMGFEYEVHDDNGIDYNKEEFEGFLGDFLTEMIIQGIAKNEVVYTGGIDED